MTVICTLHQVELALGWSDRIVGLRAGQVVLDQMNAQLSQEQVMEVYRATGTVQLFELEAELQSA
jgi:phosphonate transport system ATP-binding protein